MPSIFDKITIIVKNENVFNDFLVYTYEIKCHPWCREGEEHSPAWCWSNVQF